MEDDPLVIPLKSPRFFGWLVRRMNGNVAPHLTVTEKALSWPARWTLDWNRVTSVSIGQHAFGRSLRIETFRPDDVRFLRPSKMMSFLTWINSVFGQPTVQVSETALDRPLESVIEDLSKKAGRPLG